MRIHLATDHRGFKLKEKLKEFLKAEGHEVVDHGAFEFNADDDYPDFVRPAAEAVAKDPESRGIVLGGSGQGEAIVANRVKGARAAILYGCSFEQRKKIIILSREHNDANILSIGASSLEEEGISEEEAKQLVKLWLSTFFPGEARHQRRIDKIDLT